MAEKRLIDANAFLKDILTAGIGKTIIEYSESDIGYMIRKRPTVDAVEVVRCKDCKHYHAIIIDEKTGEIGDLGICDQPCRNEGYDVNETDYCSSAEPKEPK